MHVEPDPYSDVTNRPRTLWKTRHLDIVRILPLQRRGDVEARGFQWLHGLLCCRLGHERAHAGG